MRLNSVGIVGGGIGGVATAAALRCHGIASVIYERAPQIREVGAGMMLWPNATRALDRLGLLPQIAGRSGDSTHFLVCNTAGKVLMTLPLGAFEVPALCTRRSDVLAALLSQVPEDSIRPGFEVTALQQNASRVRISFSDGTVAEHDAVVAADGINSIIRPHIAPGSQPIYRGYTVWRGVASYSGTAVRPQHNSETWGRGRRFGILDIGQGRFTFYATANTPRRDAPHVEERRRQLQERFAGWHDPIPELIEKADIILENPACDVPRLPRWTDGRIALLGDAAHAFTPNLGQGGGMAIEDAMVLARCLAGGGPVAASLRQYEMLRRERTANVRFRSYLIGHVGQWQNRVVTSGRDFVTSMLPAAIFERNLRRIYSYET